MIRRSALVVLALLLLTGAALADVRLPGVFSDHMVLQRDKPLRVWGWADAGERVSVKIGSHTTSTVADTEGRWRVELPPMKGGGPYLLTVRGKNKVQVEDVLIGEVWLCSGQSNMEWPVSGCTDAAQDVAAADDPKIRHFKVPRVAAGTPYDDITATWQLCTPKTVGTFTACGYFMARELRKKLRVPVGLINSSWGGTRIEPWIAPVGFRSVPAVAEIAEQVAAAAGRKPKDQQQPAVLYNGMVHALVGYQMRGAIWYQGESNLGESESYTEKMKALIGGWRALWGIGDFPFLYVQIAPFTYGQSDPGVLPVFWEAQAAVLDAVPGTGMVVTNDIATLDNIHPPNKQDVGKRLALLALNRAYGKDIVDTGPRFREMTVEQDRIRVAFDHADGGLESRDRKALTHFEIAGPTGGFHAADGKIEDDAVVLTSKDVPHPIAMRFAWHKLAQPNLVNGAGLPASAFRAGELPRPDSLGTIEEASGYTLVYDLDLADLAANPGYDVNASEQIQTHFDRVAYLLELQSGDGDATYVWVSMDAFTGDAAKLGIPTVASGASFQQAVANMTVVSNVEQITSGTGLAGTIEHWPGNYGPRNASGVTGASDEVWDFGDDAGPAADGYGSMQVHALAAKQTLFAINHWSAGGARADIGIGSSTLDPRSTDWTFAGNGASYAHKRLRVFVRVR